MMKEATNKAIEYMATLPYDTLEYINSNKIAKKYNLCDSTIERIKKTIEALHERDSDLIANVNQGLVDRVASVMGVQTIKKRQQEKNADQNNKTMQDVNLSERLDEIIELLKSLLNIWGGDQNEHN